MLSRVLVVPHRFIRQSARRLGPEDDRAVSSVVGVILMVSVTVVLASVVAAFAFSFDFEHVRPIAEELLDGDLVGAAVGHFHFHAASGGPT